MQRTKRLIDSLEPRQLLAAGDLDTTFGAGAGFVVSNLPAGTPVSSVMTLLGDGKLLVAGYRIDNSGSIPVERLTLARLNATGSLDSTFGTNGISEFGSPIVGSVSAIRPTDIMVDADGSILVSYYWSSVSSGPFASSATFTSQLVRYQSNGAGSQPVTLRRKTISSSGGPAIVIGDYFDRFALAPNGRIYLVGSLADPDLPTGPTGGLRPGIARLNADGTADTSFDGDGLFFPMVSGTNPSSLSDVVAASDGTVVFAGTVSFVSGASAKFVGRRLPDGTQSTSDYYLPVSVGQPYTVAFSALGLTATGGAVFQVQELRPAPGVNTVNLFSSSIAPATQGTPYFSSVTLATTGTATAALVNGAAAASAFTTPAGDASILYGAAPQAAPLFQKTYDFGGKDEVFSMRDLGNGKLGFAGFSTYANGNGKVVVGRVLLADATATGNSVIGGVVFNDANGNGVRDASEVGIVGRTVFIDANKNGALDAAEQKTVTGAGGYYELKNLPAGTFSVRQVVPSGFVATTAVVQSIALSTTNSYRFASDFGTRAATTTAKPAVPTNVKAVIVTSPKKLVRLTWTDVATNETGYRIERRYRGATAWTGIATLGANSTRYDDSSVLNAVVYEYRIVAISSAGTSASGIVSVST